MNCMRCALFCIVLLTLPSTASAEQASVSEVRRVQTTLTTLGYEPGATDGVLGKNTRQAIKQFQRDYDLKVDGTITKALTAALQVAQRTADRQFPEKEEIDPNDIRDRLMKMDRSELIRLLETVEPKSIEPIFNLLGERAKSLPARLLWRGVVSEEIGKKSADIALQGLFYPDSEEGRKLFQEDLGAAPTGELTLEQTMELYRRYSHFRTTPVYALGWPGHFELQWREDKVVAEGTWVLEDQEIGFPVNKAKITCNKDEETCRLVQAHLEIPAIQDPEMPTYLDVSEDVYEVVSWSDGTILARGELRCLTLTLRLDQKSKDVREITRRDQTKDCNPILGADLSKRPLPKTAVLKPAWGTTYKWWQDRQRRVREFVNPRFIEEFEDIADAIP